MKRALAPPDPAPVARGSGGGPPGAGVAAPDFLGIVGPTGAGKTALSLCAARKLGGEIISVDSRQIYRGMDIGTAKASPEEQAAVPHHGLDIRDPGERYSAGEFGRDARRWITEIRARGRVAVLAGGTGFFLRVLTEPLFREPKLDPARSTALEDVLRGLPAAELERWVRLLDPARADVAVAGGKQRMLRTLSIALLTGRPLSELHRSLPAEAEPLRGMVCLLKVPPEILDLRIRRRVHAMVRAGFVEEVSALLGSGCTRDDPGLNGVGYREMADCLEGAITLGEAVERTRTATRRYARRQRTWFRRQLGPGTVTVDGTAPLEVQCAAVVKAWRARADAAARSSAHDHGAPRDSHGPSGAAAT